MDKIERLGKEVDQRQRLGRAIAVARTARGWTSQEFAVRCGFDSSFMSLVERGLRRLSPEAFDVVAKVLEIQGDLLEGFASGRVDSDRLGRWFKAAV